MRDDSRLGALGAFEGRPIDAVFFLGHAIGTGWLLCIAADLTLTARNTRLFARIIVRSFSILHCRLSIHCRLDFRGFTLSSAGMGRSSFRHQTKTRLH